MFAIVLLFLCVNPNFYLSNDELDKRFHPILPHALSRHYGLLAQGEKDLALAASPERARQLKDHLDSIRDSIESMTNRLLEERQMTRIKILEESWSDFSASITPYPREAKRR